MTHYLDIQLAADAEMPPQVLMSALFEKVHHVLAHEGKNDVGVSFPEINDEKRFLGTLLRLHGTQQSLQRFVNAAWLGGMQGYVHITGVNAVPTKVQGYRCVCRKQVKSNADRIRRRMMRRHGLTPEEALEKIPDKPKNLDLPFVRIRSASTLQEFLLFICHEEITQSARHGSFSQYGLSSEATIPWF